MNGSRLLRSEVLRYFALRNAVALGILPRSIDG